jgi:hypothetical protein
MPSLGSKREKQGRMKERQEKIKNKKLREEASHKTFGRKEL